MSFQDKAIIWLMKIVNEFPTYRKNTHDLFVNAVVCRAGVEIYTVSLSTFGHELS